MIEIIAIVALTILVLIAGIFAILGLAKMNLFFTITEEGTAKAIMSAGGFRRIIFQYQGKKIDAEGNIVDSQDIKKESLLNKLFTGLRWLGIPGIHYLYTYHFRWATLRSNGDIVERTSLINYILLKYDVYLTKVEGAESKGMVPLTIELLVTACCTNPYKAFFNAQDWLEAIINRSQAIFRQYVGEYEFEELKDQKQIVDEGVMGVMKKIQDAGLIKEFEDIFGIKVRAIEMREINPTGEAKKDIEVAATKKWLAQKDADSIKVLADAEKNRIKTVYKTIQSFGDVGTALRYLETVNAASQKQGNWIIPIDIKEILNLIKKKN